MSRVWRLRPDRSALYSRGAVDLSYFTPEPATVALSRLVGRAFYTNIPDPPDPETGNKFSLAAPAWLPGPGEDIKTFMRPTTATVVNAWDYTASRDIVTILTTIGTARSGAPTYVQLDGGRYFMYKLKNYNPGFIQGNWVGFHNSGVGHAILGLIGDSVGVDGSGNPKLNTEIVFDANMIFNSADQVNSLGVPPHLYALDPYTLGAPVPISAFYFSDSGKAAPLFFSGIHFMGMLQTPFGVYSANAQTKFNRNKAVSSPLPWNGFSVWAAQPGSRMQFCKFTGVGFALNSAPPYETCAWGTNYCRIVSYKFTIDGRTAAEFDALRRRASGGYMLNKSADETLDTWEMHYTRRSGLAFNTNTYDVAEKIHVKNHEQLMISNFGAEDPWASDVPSNFSTVAGFNNYNIEGHQGTYWIEGAHSNSAHGHVSFAQSSDYDWVENRPYLYVKDFRTDDTIFGGMFRLSTQSGQGSPVYTRLLADITLADRWFDVRRADGVRLQYVKASVATSNPNPALYNKDTHYVLRTF